MPSFVKLRNGIFEYGAEVALAATGAAEEAAKQCAEFARENVPVDTGTLKDSIESDATSAHVGGKEAFYAGWVDKGTVNMAPTGFWKKAVNKAKRQFYVKAKRAVKRH